MGHLRPARRTRPAFSLTELIVAVAILAILIGLLVPAANGVRRRAVVLADQANLRGLATAHLAYATDHDGAFADAGLPHGGLATERPAWFERLSEYGAEGEALHSPLDTSPHWPLDEGGAGTPLPGSEDRFRRTSYGFNNHLSRTYSPAVAVGDARSATDRLSQVPNPAMTVLFVPMAETGEFAGADHVHVENWWIGDPLPDAPPVIAAEQVQTHAAGGEPQDWAARATYAFVDGSTRTLPFVDVFRTPDDNLFDPVVAARSAWR